jgi:hypothetical protein
MAKIAVAACSTAVAIMASVCNMSSHGMQRTAVRGRDNISRYRNGSGQQHIYQRPASLRQR